MPDVVDFSFVELEAAPGTNIAGSHGQAVPVAPAGPTPAELARAEADAIREAARQEGLAAARAEVESVLAPALGALQAAAAEIAAVRDEVAGHVEEAAVELAFAIAEQLVRGALTVEPERVVDAVRGALRLLVERERVTVLVHPDDLDLVRAAGDGLVAQLGGIEHLEIQAERRVARGGALVRTVSGEVDATIATKLERAREAVLAAVADADGDADVDGDPSVPSAPDGIVDVG